MPEQTIRHLIGWKVQIDDADEPHEGEAKISFVSPERNSDGSAREIIEIQGLDEIEVANLAERLISCAIVTSRGERTRRELRAVLTSYDLP